MLSLNILAFGLVLLGLMTGCHSTAVRPQSSVVTAGASQAVPIEYQGLGKDSLSAETLSAFVPPALPVELSRHLQSLLDVRAPGSGMLHPNKKNLFFTWKVTGVTQVWKLNSPLSFPIQMTGGEDATSLAGITPDGRFLILSRDRMGEENPGLYLQSVDGGSLRKIQHREKVQTVFQFVSGDSKFIYYKANDIVADSFAIYRYNIAADKQELLFSEKGYWSIVDHREDGKLLLAKAVTNLASEIYEFEPKSKKLSAILGVGENEEYEVSYGAKVGEFFVLTPKFGEFRRLYLYKNKKYENISPDMKWDVASFNIDYPKKHLIYVINEGGYSRIKAIDARSLREIKLPDFEGVDHVFPGEGTRDGRMIILTAISGKAPKVSYSYDWTTGKLVQWLLPSAPEVDLSKFAVAKLESYKTRDGVDIPMFVRRPGQCLNFTKMIAPCPVVVHFHGGPEAQTEAGFSVMAQMFVDAGFIFVEPNVRGSKGYGKTWIHLDDGAKRLNVITDIPDVANFIKKKWAINGLAPKVGVMGWSYGGYSTLVAMTKFAGSFDAGVALVGMSNLRSFLLNTAPYRRALRIPEYGDPDKDQQALYELSAINYLDRVQSPLMIIQGVSDPRVPAGEAVQMYQKMKEKGLAANLILFADEGHGSQKRSNQVLELGHTIQFLSRHLGVSGGKE